MQHTFMVETKIELILAWQHPFHAIDIRSFMHCMGFVYDYHHSNDIILSFQWWLKEAIGISFSLGKHGKRSAAVEIAFTTVKPLAK